MLSFYHEHSSILGFQRHRDFLRYESLLNGSIRSFNKAFVVLESFDRFIWHEMRKFWTKSFEQSWGSAEDEFEERIRDHCPDRKFWETSLMNRLRDPESADYQFQFEMETLDKFKWDSGENRTEWMKELLFYYVEAFFTVSRM